GDVTWLSASPAAGTTAPGSSTEVTVTVDSTGLAGGDHEAALCVATNDGDQLLVPIPVSLFVDDQPVIDVVPESVTVTVEVDTTTDEELAIHNLGFGNL